MSSFCFMYRRFVQQHHPDMCILMEMRLASPSLNHIRHRIPLNWDFYVMESQGLSRDIIVV